MLWTLWDILIPLLITFSLGLLLGWLLWRWRRRRVSAVEIATRETPVVQVDDEELAQQLKNSTDQLANVKRELEVERNSNQLLKNKVDEMRQQELAEAEAGVVVDTSKVELDVRLVQLEKDRDLLQVKLNECQRKGEVQINEIATLESSLAEQQKNNQQLSSELRSAQAAQAQVESKLEHAQEGGSKTGANGHAADAAARIVELERQLEQAQAALAQNDSTALRTRLNAAESELRACNAELARAEQDLEQANQQPEQTVTTPQGLVSNSATADQSAELEVMRASIEQKNTEIDSLRSNLEALRNEAESDSSSVDGENEKGLAGWGTVSTDPQATAKYNTETKAGESRPQSAAPDQSTLAEKSAQADSGGSDVAGVGLDHQQHSGAERDSHSTPLRANVGSPVGSPETGHAAGGEFRESANDKTNSVAEDSLNCVEEQEGEATVETTSPSDELSDAAGSKQESASIATSKHSNGGATASGYVPTGWEVPSTIPDKKSRDKLTDIKGVGPKLEGVLHANGIYFFRQIALLDAAGLDELQAQMPEFRGRIQRDNWLGQAVDLQRKKYGEAP